MTNDEIVSWVERVGGQYVWEDDLFAITLLDRALDDADIDYLLNVETLDQLTVDASHLTFTELCRLAGIRGLGSLVVAGRQLTAAETAELSALGPEVDQVAEA